MRKILILVLSLLLAGNAHHVYPSCGVVVEVDREADEIVIEDLSGFLWAAYGAEDWCVGDVAAMIMDDNGTEIIFDDVILSVTYQGVIR